MNNYSLYADEIEQRVTIKEVAELYGLVFDNANFAKCPFHSEHTASFKIKDTQHAKCFGCGWYGGAIQFVKDMFCIDFKTACEKLNNDFKLGLPISRRPTLREQRDAEQRYRKRMTERAAHEAATQAEHDLYWALTGEYIRLDKNRMEFRPVEPDSEVNPHYVEAVKKIDYYGYLIDCYL